MVMHNNLNTDRVDDRIITHIKSSKVDQSIKSEVTRVAVVS